MRSELNSKKHRKHLHVFWQTMATAESGRKNETEGTTLNHITLKTQRKMLRKDKLANTACSGKIFKRAMVSKTGLSDKLQMGQLFFLTFHVPF